MDEPSEGLAAQIVAGVARTMARGRGQVDRAGGTDFLRLAPLTDDIAILDCGRVVFLGTTAELKGSDAIIARRLGVDRRADAFSRKRPSGQRTRRTGRPSPRGAARL